MSPDTCRSPEDLKAFVGALAGAEGRVVVTESFELSESFTIPPNVVLDFARGVQIAVAESRVLTINGRIDAGPQHIFSDLGRVRIGPRTPVLYPEWWGIDGREDDVAINEAVLVAAQRPRGGVVQLSRGTYELLDMIRMRSRVHLKGEGTAATTIRTVFSAPHGEKGGKRAIILQAALGADQITLSDMTIDGYRGETPDTKQVQQQGIYFLSDADAGITDAMVSRVEVRDCQDNGIEFFAQAEAFNERPPSEASRPIEARLEQVTVTGCRRAGIFGNAIKHNTARHRIEICDCDIRSNGEHGIQLANLNGLTIDGSRCERNGTVDSPGDGIALVWCEEFSVSRNQCNKNVGVDNNTGYGIKISAGCHDGLVRGNTCCENTIGGIVVDLIEEGDQTCKLHVADVSVIDNNCSRNHGMHGIYLNHVERCFVRKNVSTLNGRDPVINAGNAGIAVCGSGNEITGNEVTDNFGRGIRLDEESRCSYGGNIVTGNSCRNNRAGEYLDNQSEVNQTDWAIPR